MAGVPMIVRALLDDVLPRLKRGCRVHTCTLSALVAEGLAGADVATIEMGRPKLTIGSYPDFREDGFGVQLVARGGDPSEVEAAARE